MSIPMDYLWYRLNSLGLGGTMLLALMAIYQNLECYVKVNSQYTGYFSINQGLKQGCLLSPLLFNLYVNSIADDMWIEGKGVLLLLLLLYIYIAHFTENCSNAQYRT